MRWIFLRSFVWVILACGLISLLFIIGNLGILGLHRFPSRPYKYLVNADPKRGRAVLVSYGCIGCHTIPGIRDAKGRVGPRLTDLSNQVYIGGVLANNPENLVHWIIAPQSFAPGTAMPNLGVTLEDAKDMAEYLYRSGS